MTKPDISMGVEICIEHEIYSYHTSLQKVINETIERYHEDIVKELNLRLDTNQDTLKQRSGILRLAYYTRDPALLDSIINSWNMETEENKLELHAEYFLAGVYCSGSDPSVLLDSIFDVWSSLPEGKGNELDQVTRGNFAAFSVHDVLKRYPPPTVVIEYFIKQTRRNELSCPITYMINGVDHPLVVQYIANYLANHSELSAFHIYQDWKNKERYQGNSISAAARDKLFMLWSDAQQKEELRKMALKLWTIPHKKNDLYILKNFEHDKVLHDQLILARIMRKDKTALPQYENILQANLDDSYWWQFFREIWSDNLSALLNEYLIKRSKFVERKWENSYYKADWVIPKLITRLQTNEAEKIFKTHWDHLKYNSDYILAALFVSTPELKRLVAEALPNFSDINKIFDHLFMAWELKTEGSPGATRLEQLEGLLPYLDNLSKMDIYELFDLCNKRGWIKFRKKYLDQIIIKIDEREYSGFLCRKKAIEYLTRIVKERKNEKHVFWIDFWIDKFQKTGATADYILDIVFDWIKSIDHINIYELKTALQAINKAGNRNHFNKLLEVCSNVKEEYKEYFENELYALKRKQLL